MYIELRNINKSFGSFKASDNVSFGLEKGKLIGLLGPSGSGKTTILRMLAGLEKQDSGDILINGRNVNGVPASERGIGFVFQNYALFPFMTVNANIAYGLKVQKKDEPFAAIDAKVRKELRTWLRETIDKIGITSIFVTHDQDEAIEVADEIVVTNNGRVEQVGSPSEIYLEPATPFVAQFIGQSVVIEDLGRLKGFSGSGKALIRPEFIEINKFEDNGFHEFETAMENAVVDDVSFRGNAFEVRASIGDISVTGRYPLSSPRLHKGDGVKIFIKKLYTIDDNSTSIIVNKALDVSDVYYI